MSRTDQRQLLERLRTAHARFGAATGPDDAPQAPVSDLSALDAYGRIRIAKSAGEVLGLASPFFREIESQSGTKVVIAGRTATNFASYDYLSLNQAPALADAVAAAARTWGVSASASRLVGGEHSYHRRLETALAAFLGTEDAVVFVSGYLTNLTAVRTLVDAGDLVLVDARAHNSIYEGIRGSAAEHVSFPHNDWGWVAEHLAANRDRYRHVLIVVEGLYSMDGDVPDLARFVEVKRRFGAWLMVDEAHSVGVLGATGRGLREAQGVAAGDVDVTMGTLSKSFCSCGGFLAGSKVLGEILRHAGPGFVYSVGLPAPSAAAAQTALDLIAEGPDRVARLAQLSRHFKDTAARLGLETGDSIASAVQPVFVGDSVRATWVSNALLEAGFNVLPIIAPAVPDRAARLRFFLNADHDTEAIDDALAATARLLEASRSRFPAKA